ncbi:MAG: GntR family transcriptional regulator [Chloroflexota bacterium]|jgi:DNA-binding GntR family transcriptional regulator
MDRLETYLSKQPESLADSATLLRRELAYERLKDALQHAELEPGEVLSETRLSRALGISRTPVREALQQLAQEGLVQVIPGRAVTVAAPSVRSVMDVVHLRMLLEPELVRLATEALTEEEIRNLVRTVDKMDVACQSGDHLSWSRADTEFHEIMGEACPNQLLAEVVIQMRNRAHHLANIDSQTNPNRLIECTVEHRAIADCIVARDSDGASQAMRAHIEMLRQSLFSRLNY